MLDLSGYAARIHSSADKPIFGEAVNCAAAGAHRAAYIMIWISCAESFKRRFREAQKRDGTAGKIVGQFEKKETEQNSVDKFLLDKAKEYGFLGESAIKVLLNIYEMRCLYGHPYEEAPTEEQVIHAAAMVVEHVLSQPVQLRHGFARSLLESLLGDRNFLDDEDTAIESFAEDVLPRIDERVVGWFLDAYWKELETIADDASMSLFRDRGILFSRATLDFCGVGVFTHDQWHQKLALYPKTLVRVLGRKRFFESVGSRAQDYLIGTALEQAQKRASILQYLERLSDEDALSERQRNRFISHIEEMDAKAFRAAGLATKTCFAEIISALKSYNWYAQKPAVDLVVANGPSDIEALDKDDQEQLGRNILQAADGAERSARRFLKSVAEEPQQWPTVFIGGIALECFVNDAQLVRLKQGQLVLVLKIIEGLKELQRAAILERLSRSIVKGTPKEVYLGKKDFNSVVEMCEAYAWGSNLAKELKARESDFVTEDDDDE